MEANSVPATAADQPAHDGANQRFTKEHTALCKGVACLLLLYHHLFYREQMLTQCCTVLDRLTGGTQGILFVLDTAHISKVCVALFLILSGYGLSESWKSHAGLPEVQRSPNRALVRFSLERLLRLMIRFWLIFLLFVPFGPMFGRDPAVLFASSTKLKMLVKIAIDFFGMSNLVFGSGQYTFNGTWWYMSVMILSYLSFPLLQRLSRKSPLLLMPVMLLCALGMFVPYVKNVAFWLIPFVLGMLLSGYGLLDRMVRVVASRPAFIGIAGSALIVVCLAFLRGRNRYVLDPLLAMAIILFCIAALSRLKGVCAALRYIGKHSANIFLFHSFLCAYYFAFIIYSPRYPLLILLLLLVLSLLISICMEGGVRWASGLFQRIRHKPAGTQA